SADLTDGRWSGGRTPIGRLRRTASERWWWNSGSGQDLDERHPYAHDGSLAGGRRTDGDGWTGTDRCSRPFDGEHPAARSQDLPLRRRLIRRDPAENGVRRLHVWNGARSALTRGTGAAG